MARKIATWRPVAITIWDDLKFLSLSDDAKLLFLYFITSSDCPIAGVLVAGEGTVAEHRGWMVEKVRTCYSEMLKKGIDVRWEGRVLWCANGFRHQPVAGPNVMKSMAVAWRNLPQVSFTHLMWTAIRDATKGWPREFKELFPEPPRISVPVTSPSDQVLLPWGTPLPNQVPNPLTQPLRYKRGWVQQQQQDLDQGQEVFQTLLFRNQSPLRWGAVEITIQHDPRQRCASCRSMTA